MPSLARSRHVPKPPSASLKLELSSRYKNLTPGHKFPSPSTENVEHVITHQKTIKTVCEWFTTWRAWQQRILLSGIANRCSIYQLESLATTLEPVFHRDFGTSVSLTYPLSQIKNKKDHNAVIKEDRSWKNESTPLERQHPSESDPIQQSFDPTNDQHVVALYKYAGILVDDTIKKSLETIGRIGIQANEDDATEEIPHNGQNADKPVVPNKLTFQDTLSVLVGEGRHEGSQHHNAWLCHPTAPNTTRGGHYSRRLKSMDSAIRREATTATLRLVRSVDFFSARPTLGPMTGVLRTGGVCKPPAMTDVSVPIQRLYKHAKWFGAQPREGLKFVRPHRSSLARHYRQQLNQVWELIADWEEHKSFALLVSIVKLCEPEQLSHLATCLYHKLQERIDISCLPDRILLIIFSNLDTPDIFSCQQVCQRWRYLCSVDQLWQYKCLELGCSMGVSELVQKIHRASTESGNSVDWCRAHHELERITRLTKRPVPQHTKRRVKVEPVRLSQAAQLAKQSARLKQGLDLEEGFVRVKYRRYHSGSTGSQSSTDREEGSTQAGSDADRLSTTQSVHSLPSPDYNVSRQSQRELTPHQPPVLLSSEEKALDVRTSLTQAPDLLEKNSSEYSLRWRERTPNGSKSGGSVRPVKQARRLQGHQTSVLCVVMDGRRLVSGGADHSVRVWDVCTGHSIHDLYGHKGAVTSLKLHKTTLYSASWDEAIIVWDLVTFTRRAVLTGHTGTVSCLDLTPHHLVSGSHDGSVRVWCVDSLDCVRVINSHSNHVLCIQHEAGRIYSGSSDQTIHVTELDSGQNVGVLTGSAGPVHRLLVRGELCISCDTTGLLYFWDVTSASLQAVIQPHAGAPVTALAFHKSHFFTASSDHKVKEWDLVTMTCVRMLVGHQATINDFKVSDSRLVSCDADGQIRAWDFTAKRSSRPIDDVLAHQQVHEDECP